MILKNPAPDWGHVSEKSQERAASQENVDLPLFPSCF
jgi:hypothetical protein